MKTFATFLSFSLVILNLLAQDPILFDINSLLNQNLNAADGNNTQTQYLSRPHSLIQSRNLTEKPDSSHYWEWNYVGQHWDLVSRSFYTEDITQNTATRFELRWRHNQWENSRIDSTTFNTNYIPASVITLEWDGLNWVNSVLITNTYNASNDLVEQVTQFWDHAEWENFLSVQSTYDSNHHLVTEQFGTWVNGQWDFRDKALYAYNPGHTLDLSVYQIFESGQWKDNYREQFTYDINNKLIVKSSQNIIAGEWNNSSQILYNYYGLSQDLIIQEFINGNWENKTHYVETSNSNQNLLSSLRQIWQLNWVNKDSSQYYYAEETALKNIIPDETGIAIFPNPASNLLNITSTNDDLSDINMEIFTNTGIKVTEGKITSLQNKTIDISNLIPGEYHVLIKSGKGVTIRNFVKI